MPILSVTLKNHTIIRIDFASGSNLFDLLNSQERTKVRSVCQKNGTCGLCLVRIDEGEVSALSEHEQQRVVG
jgi:ferredoxin